jgi:signal transduction histidine kinase
MARHFKVDARAILTLGRDSIKDHTTAVVELVKNSYDAGARAVDVEIRVADPDPDNWYLRISDNGIGMAPTEVEDNWLRIGYSEKRVNKMIGNRRKVGEKGIGRISADRLGAVLELRTQARHEEAVGLLVEWDKFDRPGTDLQKVDIEDLEHVSFAVPQPWTVDTGGQENRVPGEPNTLTRTGTELLIRQLRQRWLSDEIDLLNEELSILTPPFDAVNDFQVRLTTDLGGQDGIVQSGFIETWELDGHFEYRGGRHPIRYRITERGESGRSRVADEGEVEWPRLVHRNVRGTGDAQRSETPSFGPVQVRLMFFPRSAMALRNTRFSLADLRDFLNRNAGVKIYRDRVRVKPYGSPGSAEGDWLGLGERKSRDPAGPKRKTFRFAPTQVVGAVFLTRDANPEIADSSSREGLVHGQAFSDLKDFVMGCLTLVETAYRDVYKRRQEKNPPAPDPGEKVRELGEDLRSLASQLRGVREAIPSRAARTVERSLDQLSTTVERIQDARKSLEELANQSIVYRGLATLGITSATFGHETQVTLQGVLNSANASRHYLKAKPPRLEAAVEEIERAIAKAKRVAEWGGFALSRISRNQRRRRKQDIRALVEKVIDGMRPSITGSDVEITTRLRDLEGSVFGMDVESVLINLLTNAYDFCKQSTRTRVIAVELAPKSADGQKGMELIVSDSGPGVAKKFVDRIWEPMFSTKLSERGEQWGTGLGLTIVDAIVREMEGKRSVDKDPTLLGARFTIWLPLGG